jgi:hypothetical protein
MTRKDSEKDSDRPHYYSQFWLDVAAGRRVIGTPKPEENEGVEPEPSEPAPAPRRPTRLAQNDTSNGHADSGAIVHPVAEPITTPDAFIEPDVDDFAENDDLEFQAPEDADIPDVIGDISDEEDEELFDEEVEEGEEGEEGEEDEDEDDIGWSSARGRKKTTRPTRAVKPAAKKPGSGGRREPRRGY